MDADHEAVLKTFLAESEESFAATETALIALETRPADRGLLEAIFRATHTLKGNAFSLGLADVSEFAHALEDVLEGVRSGAISVTTPLVTLLLDAVDALREMVPDSVAGNEQSSPRQLLALAALRRAAAEPAAFRGEAPPAAATVRRRGRTAPHATEDLLVRSRTLRVDLDKLDRMLDLTGEITIALGRLREQLAGRERNSRDALLETHDEVERLHLELQERVMKIRMVPVGPTFRSLVRSVRDCAAPLGRLVRLELEGEDVEVDTRVIEGLRDPLTHLIRNAVDHGIEPPSAREASGKDPCGRITLRAFHDAGSVVIEVADDGAGFRRERIAARARERGLCAEPERLSEQELYRLVFEPGFSTAESVTALSGRGVGLDVVLRNLESLHGTIQIASREGAGSTLSLRLPLTLAIIAGFGVAAGGETFLLPLDHVIECLELPSAGRGSTSPAGAGLLDLRGDPLPYARLSEVFALDAPRAERESVVVVRYEGGRAGLVVDDLHGESQTVIKPLSRVFQGARGIAGSTILANGRVALILDVPALMREVMRSAGAVARAEAL